jgi:hypothetical protein
VLPSHLKAFGGYFPDKVKWDAETHSVEVTEQMPLELRVSISYVSLVGKFKMSWTTSSSSSSTCYRSPDVLRKTL